MHLLDFPPFGELFTFLPHLYLSADEPWSLSSQPWVTSHIRRGAPAQGEIKGHSPLWSLEISRGSSLKTTTYRTTRQLTISQHSSILAMFHIRQFWYFLPTLPFQYLPECTLLVLLRLGYHPGFRLQDVIREGLFILTHYVCRPLTGGLM